MKKNLITTALFALLATPIIVNCGEVNKLKGAAKGLSDQMPDCPSGTDPDAILAYDFQAGFGLQAAQATKIRGAIAASAEITGFYGAIDGDLKTGCGNLAHDLGVTGDFSNGEEACKAAIAAMNAAKAKLGASIKVTLVAQPPRCEASMDVMADCAAKCDVQATGGSAKVECEPGKLSGSCGAQCSGSCQVEAGAKCEGTCKGTCDVAIKGKCAGTCNGKCDGKAGNGSCAGVCEGKCEGGSVEAACSGKCGGTCEMKASAKCEGTCTGSCSAEMKAPKCTGEVTPPKVSAECNAQCDARVSARAKCEPGKVSVAIIGATDVNGAKQLQAALEKNLPAIFNVAIGMKDRALHVAGSGKLVVDGAKASIESAGAASAKLGLCFGSTLKGAVSAVANIKADIDVSVNVSASASASGSASGSAGK
jgi:hypothetical protein